MFARLMGLKTLSPTDTLVLLDLGQATAIDVNAPSRWAQARVPGARNLDPEHFSADELPGDRGATLVFYCSNAMCRKAPLAARRAKRLGFTDARVMSAGITGWVTAGLPVETEADASVKPGDHAYHLKPCGGDFSGGAMATAAAALGRRSFGVGPDSGMLSFQVHD